MESFQLSESLQGLQLEFHLVVSLAMQSACDIPIGALIVLDLGLRGFGLSRALLEIWLDSASTDSA